VISGQIASERIVGKQETEKAFLLTSGLPVVKKVL